MQEPVNRQEGGRLNERSARMDRTFPFHGCSVIAVRALGVSPVRAAIAADSRSVSMRTIRFGLAPGRPRKRRNSCAEWHRRRA